MDGGYSTLDLAMYLELRVFIILCLESIPITLQAPTYLISTGFRHYLSCSGAIKIVPYQTPKTTTTPSNALRLVDLPPPCFLYFAVLATTIPDTPIVWDWVARFCLFYLAIWYRLGGGWTGLADSHT